jgi:hypothetical protein
MAKKAKDGKGRGRPIGANDRTQRKPRLISNPMDANRQRRKRHLDMMIGRVVAQHVAEERAADPEDQASVRPALFVRGRMIELPSDPVGAARVFREAAVRLHKEARAFIVRERRSKLTPKKS